VAHDSAQVQNRNAGSPDIPKTRLSTIKMETTAQATRPPFARESVLKAFSPELS
jgi:hypothetical protein